MKKSLKYRYDWRGFAVEGFCKLLGKGVESIKLSSSIDVMTNSWVETELIFWENKTLTDCSWPFESSIVKIPIHGNFASMAEPLGGCSGYLVLTYASTEGGHWDVETSFCKPGNEGWDSRDTSGEAKFTDRCTVDDVSLELACSRVRDMAGTLAIPLLLFLPRSVSKWQSLTETTVLSVRLRPTTGYGLTRSAIWWTRVSRAVWLASVVSSQRICLVPVYNISVGIKLNIYRWKSYYQRLS